MQQSMMRCSGLSVQAAVIGALAIFLAGSAFGDSFEVSYLAPGVQIPQTGIKYDSFAGITPGSANLPYQTSFNGSGYSGTYTGGVQWSGADQYGGAGGTGTYAETFTGYTLTINPSVNYFGLWFSALDAGNQLSFYRGSSLIYSFTPTDFLNLVGSCPGTGFCGNPNTNFKGANNTQQYAYLNFYDPANTFDRIVFSQTGGGGFESDNHGVAVLNSAPGGTLIGSPEPASFGTALLAAGLLVAGKWGRRRSL